ncbi:hypothetical protein GCM10009623_05540 [Nocardioides aestuarii]|uniref:Type II CAAX endopeptidase family protein n=1 Tax=Nocardioides aestuarii TaxID=252231 RepID=A0ABW4TIM0_9ACTN
MTQPLQDPYATDPYGRWPGEERVGLPYHLVLRGGWSGAWWRALIGLLVLGIAMMLVLPFVVLVPFVLWYAVTGQDVGSQVGGLVDLGDPSPASLAYLNITLAALIPVTWVIVRLLHGLRPRWLSSVAPRLRWKFLVVCLGLSVVALLATVVVSALVPQDASASMSGDVNELTPTIRDFALVVLLLTPLQAAAEEYAFRGYLLQAFGGLVRHPAFAVLLSSLLFALAHGAQDAPIFVDRFAFGLVAGTLVVVTGGLEAGIAMHVLNNWLAFGVTLAFGDMSSALNPSGGSWWNLPVTLTQSLVYLGLAWWVARRMGLATRTDPAVLAAPETRV